MNGEGTLPITAADIQGAIAAAEMKACDEYSKAFRQRKQESSGAVRDAWNELWLIASLYPAFDGAAAAKEPFPGIDLISNISDEHLAAWAALADAVGDAELIARCSDLYWIRRKAAGKPPSGIDRAKIAVPAYTIAARTLGFGDQSSVQCFTRFQRALKLAKTIGANDMRVQTAEIILNLLRASDPTKYGERAGGGRIIALLRGEAVDCTAECIAWCDAAAQRAEELARAERPDVHYEVARFYLEEKIAWLRKANLSSDIETTWRRIAANHTAVAAAFENSNLPTPKLVAAKWIEDAIAALRHGNAPDADIEALHRRLLALQADGVKEIRPTDQRIDVTAMAKAAIARVAGQPFVGALIGLATCTPVPAASQVRAAIDAQEGVARHLAVAQINRRGMQTAFRDGYADGDEEAVDAELVSRMSSYQRVIAQGAVAPARDVLLDSHPVVLADMERFARSSPFVPQGRESTYARGLFAGFEGDWLLVAHLLPPQIENSLRVLCEAAGIIASGLHRNRQHDFDLNKLFAMDEVENVLGPDLLLDMKASLAHGFGANVRNLTAHGLLDDREFDTVQVLYVWWLALRLVLILPGLVPGGAPEADKNTDPETSASPETGGATPPEG